MISVSQYEICVQAIALMCIHFDGCGVITTPW